MNILNRPATFNTMIHQDNNKYHSLSNSTHFNNLTMMEEDCAATTNTTTTITTTNKIDKMIVSPPSPTAIRVMFPVVSPPCESNTKTPLHLVHSPSSPTSQHDDSDSSFSPASSSNSSSSHSKTNSSISKSNRTKVSRKTVNNTKKHAKITSSIHKSKYTPESKKKSKIKIPVFELIRVMALPQSTAANCLGVSLSTLKRRYYELGIGRWPGQVNVTKDIDLDVPSSEKTKMSYLLNDDNLDSARELDQVTLAILNFTFKQTF